MTARMPGQSSRQYASITYLSRLSPGEAEGLLIAIEALKDWLWDMHGEAIEHMYGEDESLFCTTHADEPDFLKEKTK